MRADEVVGWVDVEGQATYCAACAPSNEAFEPIFPHHETDTPTHCDVCGELIAQTLTTEGWDYLLGALEAFLITDKGRPEIIRQWATYAHDATTGGREHTLSDLVLRKVEHLERT